MTQSSALTTLTSHLGASVAYVVPTQCIPHALAPIFVDPTTTCISSLGGVPLATPNVRELSRKAHATGQHMLCFNGLATWVLCAAAQLGADVVNESLALSAPRTASNLSCVAFSRAASSWAPIHTCRENLAACQVDKATLDALVDEFGNAPERIRGASDAAQATASYLRCHPLVSSVHYPGLVQDSSYAAASGMLRQGFGPWIDFCVVPITNTYKLITDLQLQLSRIRSACSVYLVSNTTIRVRVSAFSDASLCEALEHALRKSVA